MVESWIVVLPYYYIGKVGEALINLDKAIQLKPDYPEAYTNRGNVLKNLGRLNDALMSHEKAIQLDPDCFSAYSNYLMTSTYMADFLSGDYLNVARQFSSVAISKATSHFSNYIISPANDRLKVGLVSGDLCNHPVGYFIEGILDHLSNFKIEVISYPTVPKQDSLTKRIKPLFSKWKPIYGLSDESAANLIYADGVHILIDLARHTAHNRLPIFA
jgi:protein O-GlcNAc transferase